MGEYIAGRELVAPRLEWSKMTWHTRDQYAELENTVAQLASLFRAIPVEAALSRVEATEWSMGWETGLLECCHGLATAADSLIAAIKALSELCAIPALADVSSSQLSALYRFAQTLMRPELPSAELLLNDQLGELSSLLDNRQALLDRSRQAHEALEAAVFEFCTALGATASNPIAETTRRAIYRVANELIRPRLPPSEIVFHANFDGLSEGLANRPALLQARAAAFESLLARSYSPALIERVPLELLERRWTSACKSLWPLSAWGKREIRKKLQAYMNPGGSADPEIDLPLLREYRDACARSVHNLTSLGLPSHLEASVEKDAGALDDSLGSARRLREAFAAAGLSPADVGAASQHALQPLIDAARRIYPPGRDAESLRQKLTENLVATELSPGLRGTIEKDARALTAQIQLANNIRDAARSLGIAPGQIPHVLNAVVGASTGVRREVATACCRTAKKFQEAWVAYVRFAAETPASTDSTSVISDAASQARGVLTRRTALKQWTAWVKIRQRAEKLGLSSFVKAIQLGEIQASDAVARFRLAYARWWLPGVIDGREPLRTFQKFLHEITIEEFYQLDDKARLAAAPRARQSVLHGLPASDQVPRQSELGLLRHQIGLKRPSKSIREIITGMPLTFGKLAPCLLMSPLSIAQYLPANYEQFDVVVFDEASQIATWDAVGAIARGKQTIIVGDPKQLPPTNFFGKAENDEENIELQDHEKDLESILDEAQASGLPTLQLNWHYRSRHESLIAFSNWNYYGNRLVTFPAAESEDRGVTFRHIRDGIYDRGKSRTNRQEAEAIVADLVERMKRCLRKPNAQRLTYGVVTFNSQQQELIQDLLDEALRKTPELEWFFSDERIEPTAIKNLENVQGDERDVMMFSITFGFDAAGKFPIDFGAINRDGGERRLNVAVTRARQQLVVFASFLPDQLRAERSSKRGVHDLKAFLEYADQGPQAIIATTEGSVGGHESPLEEAVSAALEKRGWRIDTQVGVSGFRIDLGIVHPDKPGAYLAGVECDGATYHRSIVARDRDKIRQQVLENLGWTILRVWSVDWWYDAQSAIDQLDRKLSELLERARQAIATSPATLGNEESETVTSDSGRVTGGTVDYELAVLGDVGEQRMSETGESTERQMESRLFAKQTPGKERRIYVRAKLDDATPNQGRFFDDEYSETLRDMALSVLESQGPIRDDSLVNEVARAHGFARTGNRIKQRVLDLLQDVTSTVEPIGTFLWSSQSAQESLPFRYHSTDEDRRNLNEIPMPELVGLVRENPDLIASDDPAVALARELGLARLSNAARKRIEEALKANENYCR
jgi:very-short-patch-repair endonuclease